MQLAAYSARTEAQALVTRLAAKGIEARVDGTVAPFRVRVGRYAVRTDAALRLRELKAQGYEGFVADVPPEGSPR